MSFSTRTMKTKDWELIKHFKPSEFKTPSKMGFEFMQWLDELRERAGVPIIITSSYRSPAYNKSVGGATNSAHTDVPCDAIDIGMRPRKNDPNWNFSRWQIVKIAIEMGCQRIGSYSNGSLHLDMTHNKRPAPRMWRVVGAEKQ